jgi:hypothetical protein
MTLQILSLVLDNASNNNTLVSELEELLDGYQGSLTRIPCFAHVLNLVVKVRSDCPTSPDISVMPDQAILSQFSKKNNGKSKENEVAEDNAAFEDLECTADDEEMDPDDEEECDDDDDIDATVESSDCAMIDALVDEMVGEVEDNDSFEFRQLTREEINLGRFSLLKVCRTIDLEEKLGSRC